MRAETLPSKNLEGPMSVIVKSAGQGRSLESEKSVGFGLFWSAQINGHRCGDVIMSGSYKENSKTHHIPLVLSRSLMSAATKGQRTKTRTQFMIRGERNKTGEESAVCFLSCEASSLLRSGRWWCKEVVCLSQKEPLYSSRPESCAPGPI